MPKSRNRIKKKQVDILVLLGESDLKLPNVNLLIIEPSKNYTLFKNEFISCEKVVSI